MDERESFFARMIPMGEAEGLVIDYISTLKGSGRRKVSLLELEMELGVSEEQAKSIMEKLKASGVREVE